MCPLPLAAAAVTAPRTPLRLLGRGLAAAMSTARPLKSVDYEVFGRVQGVCFRMYTEDEARKIGVVGWVKNTSKGTVTGQVQGPEEKVNSIKTPLPFTDLNHSYQGQEQHIKSTSFQGTDDWNTPRKSWLSKVGSPSSRIDRTNFSNEKTISKLEYSSFNIRY
ncbi:acylphosphatase-2 isoform X4 [Bubalus kerabau]|uniref:acylphosphatase-2 isoform X3 n=1 Tax=Bubalus bubalis TaxID=89462 RepID=UPI000DBC9040|nr:acylphosphatase-2 isoform X3 [Bubalus bubalis]XP_055396074.1 acylphosphatase-2 isoform X4 [Bubalus carabanensis]